MKKPANKTSAMVVTPDGVPSFPGGSVPIAAMFDYLALGHSLDQFIAHHGSVERAQAVALLDRASRLVREELQKPAASPMPVPHTTKWTREKKKPNLAPPMAIGVPASGAPALVV